MSLYSPPCSLPRRLGAMVYDAVLLCAVLIAATVPVVLIHGGAVDGDAWFSLYLLAISYAYFGGFWVLGRQTLGMRTWRIVLIRDDGGRPGWRDALLRFVTAMLSWLVLGGGFIWSLFDRERRTLHDILSGTSLVVLPRQHRSDDPAQGDDPGDAE